jgi:pimeloyl-ACP methyl ester carboxylesterase
MWFCPGNELLPRVGVPTLVMHKRDDQVQPFEAGRELAAGIPGARFVADHRPGRQILGGENLDMLDWSANAGRGVRHAGFFPKGFHPSSRLPYPEGAATEAGVGPP